MHLNFRRSPNWWAIYVIIGLLSLLITSLIYSLFLPFNRYRLICKDLHSKDLMDAKKSYVFYSDLNLDGLTEKITLNRISAYRSNPFIKISNDDGRLIFKKQLKEQWLYNDWIVGDYNNDSLKEIYIFTRKRHSNVHDSLFLYGVNPFGKKKVLLNRVYISSFDRYFKQLITGKPWALKVQVIGFMDADDDGFDDLVFSMNSENYRTPRKIYVFSIKKRKIILKSNEFYHKYDWKLIKDQDNHVEIFPTSESTFRNQFINGAENQKEFRFFVLDKKLNFIIKPIPFKLFMISKMHYYLIPGKPKRFIAQYIWSGRTYFSLLDGSGKILKKNKYQGYFHPLQKVMRENDTPLIYPFVFYQNFGSLCKVDSTLQSHVYFKWKKRHGNYYFYFNIDDDPQPEIIDIIFPLNSKYKKLAIFQDDLKTNISMNIPYLSDSRELIFSIKSKTPKSTVFSLSSQYFDSLFQYELNPYYHLNFFVIFLSFLVITFMLYAFFKLINLLFFYYHFLSRHLNTVNKGVLLISFRGKVQHFNQNFVRILDIPSIRPGMTVDRIFASYPQILDVVKKLLSGTRNEISEDLTLQKSDKTLKGRMFAYLISGMAGVPSGYCLEIYDFSESILSEREEIIARLIRKMAHDIKTPLSTIKFAIEALNYVLPDKEYQKVEEDITTVSEEVNHIHAIASSYSKFARLSKLNLEIISIKEVILKVIGSYSYLDTVKVSVHIAPDAEMLTADGAQIELLIKEIFENALDAVGKEGEINFETYPIALGDNGHSEAISLRISDTGMGIAKEIIDRVFEPSFSTKGHGTGFGLLLAQRIVQNHGGKITIDSQEGKGTHVLIILPKIAMVNMDKKDGYDNY